MLFSTSIPNLNADITFKEMPNGRIYAVANGVDPEDESVYEGLRDIKTKTYSPKRKLQAETAAIVKLVKLYNKLYGYEPKTENDMTAAFEKVKNAVMDEHLRISPGWKRAATNINAIKYYERNTLPFLLKFADVNQRKFLKSDLKELEEFLIQETNLRKDSNAENAKVQARKHIKEAAMIYALMRMEDIRLPEISLTLADDFVPPVKPEQIKSLPRPILLAFYRLLDKLVTASPKFVFFCVFVVFGLRPAEAAGRKPCEIVWQSTFCTVEVSSQEVNGLISPELKNEYSRRIVIISYWGMQLLRRCCELIGDDYPHDNTSMNIAIKCAQRVKQMLLEECGCSEWLLRSEAEKIDKDDLDSADELQDPEVYHAKIGCYVLRRVFTTILRSIMGMTLYETDRMLGHKPVSENNHIELNDLDTQTAIAQKMERYVFDQRYTLNPAYNLHKLSDGPDFHSIEFSEYVIENDTDQMQRIEINLTAAETGEEVKIYMPSGTSNIDLNSFSKQKSWENYNRIVIGETTLREYEGELYENNQE